MEGCAMDKIKESVVEIIEGILELKLHNDELEKPIDELLDSISFIRIVVQCETEYGFEFEDEKLLLAKFENLLVLIDYIIEKSSENKEKLKESI